MPTTTLISCTYRDLPHRQTDREGHSFKPHLYDTRQPRNHPFDHPLEELMYRYLETTPSQYSKAPDFTDLVKVGHRSTTAPSTNAPISLTDLYFANPVDLKATTVLTDLSLLLVYIVFLPAAIAAEEKYLGKGKSVERS